MNPLVSIVIPTYNRRPLLARLLDALNGAHWMGARFEVVVAVDGSTDGTREMLAAKRTPYPLRWIEGAQQGPAAARNRAIREATGEIVLFLDDDVVPVAGLIEQHLEVHRRDPQAAVIGPMIAPPGSTLASWLRWEAWTLQKQHDAMLRGDWDPTPRQFYTANASVRRSALLNADGFDETFKRAEDVELARRLEDAGTRFYYLPGAAVLHEPHRSFEAWMRVPYEYGQNDVRMQVEGGRSTLDDAYADWTTRHPLNRALPTFCVGRERRTRLTVAALTRAIHTAATLRAPERLQLALCSALYNVRYWQGIADATGLGKNVWRSKSAAPAPKAKRAAGETERPAQVQDLSVHVAPVAPAEAAA